MLTVGSRFDAADWVLVQTMGATKGKQPKETLVSCALSAVVLY